MTSLEIAYFILLGFDFITLFLVVYLSYKFLVVLVRRKYEKFFEDYIGYFYPIPLLSMMLICISFGLGFHIEEFRISIDDKLIDLHYIFDIIDELCYLLLLVYLNWVLPKLLQYPIVTVIHSNLRLENKCCEHCMPNNKHTEDKDA